MCGTKEKLKYILDISSTNIYLLVFECCFSSICNGTHHSLCFYWTCNDIYVEDFSYILDKYVV
jgi:hypothetical protein